MVGHSETGAMDKVDGPYYFFPTMKRMRDNLPAWLPLVGVDLGDTNVVPVDYVAKAMDHLAHLPDHDGEAFHLVNPDPQPVVDMVNAFCTAAGAPTFATPVDRRLTTGGPMALRPAAAPPAPLLNGVLKTVADAVGARPDRRPDGHPGRGARALVVHRGLRLPAHREGAGRLRHRRARSSSPTPAPCGATGRRTSTSPPAATRKIREALKGKHVVITGASSGIGLVTALKVAQAGGIPVLVARGKDKLEETRAAIERRGGTAHVYPCDLSDLEAIDSLCDQLTTELPSVDFVVNNAGRSIRRSLKLSHDRFHDFERTMQLNYFGAIRLVMGLLPAMRGQKRGHIVNISSIGVQTNPPRFSAYVASKAALDSWSNVVSSELVGDGITFTGIHMPLVRTPMIAPTKIYDKFPTISPAQAADLVIKAMVDRPHEINTLLGNVGAVAHTVAPKLAFRVLNMAYHVFPDSAAAKGEPAAGGTRESEQIMLARCSRASTGSVSRVDGSSGSVIQPLQPPG